MADISTYLAQIMSAVFGKDVRSSIHDAIDVINQAQEKAINSGTAINAGDPVTGSFYENALYINTSTNQLLRCDGTEWQAVGSIRGTGISSVSKTGTLGLVDTYTITYTDGTTDTFDITNGRNGTDGKDGNMWYKGTAISGTGSSITGYPGKVGDCYLNADDAMVYMCTSPGDALTATWTYVLTIVGGSGVTVIDDLTSDSPYDALSAHQGKVLKGILDNKAASVHTHTKNQITDLVIPDVYDGVLTIQQNGTTIETFSANTNSNKSINIITDRWSSVETAAQVGDDIILEFDNLNPNYGYELYMDDLNLYYLEGEENPGTESGTIKLTYKLCEDATAGTTTGKLRILV